MKELLFVCFWIILSCKGNPKPDKGNFLQSHVREKNGLKLHSENLICGADQLDTLIRWLSDRPFGLIANQSSRCGNKLLLDTLIALKKSPEILFAPEHGFQGKAEAGEKFATSNEEKSKLKIISLYGKNRKPQATDLKGIQVIVFDLQDVGARFYTYISTLHFVMEACAENNLELIILDRPNPNGFYVDGPILNPAYSSFVGMHPVPIVHGMTIGEYGQMINGEKWLSDNVSCHLRVLTMKGYDHNSLVTLPVPPSPNLRSTQSILLYPGLCLFEGTSFSVGRGTDRPFEWYGHPELQKSDTFFIPEKGTSIQFPHQEVKCMAHFARNETDKIIRDKKMPLHYLLDAYLNFPNKDQFFLEFFYKLSGSKTLRNQIESGWTEELIRKSWEKDLIAYRKIRKKYLLYADFSE